MSDSYDMVVSCPQIIKHQGPAENDVLCAFFINLACDEIC